MFLLFVCLCATLWLHLEDTILLIGKVLLIDPVKFLKYKECPSIGPVQYMKQKRSVSLLCRLFCLVKIPGHAHSFSGGVLFNWRSVLSTKANFGDMFYIRIVSNNKSHP